MAHRSDDYKAFGSALKYSLIAEDSYSMGKPIILGFTLENLTNECFWILTWYTPLEGLKGRIFKVTCSGKEILYNGPMVKRGGPELADYVRIGPKGSVSAKVVLSAAYSLPVSNECRVEFEGRIHDIVRDTNFVFIGRDEHHWIDIKGNAVAFRVVGPLRE